MLIKAPKERLNLFELENEEFYYSRLRTENPQDFITASNLIFQY